MLLLKEQLAGSYEWPAEREGLRFDNVATRRLFNRWNGYQTLFVINVFLMEAGLVPAQYGKKVEEILLNKLPLDAMSEKKVVAWLNEQAKGIIF